MTLDVTEWRSARLDELGFVGRGKSRHRPRNAAFLYGGRYPFFQTGDIKAASFHLTEYTQTYSDEGLAQSKLWKAGTLCITIAANIAESAILGIEGCFPDSVVGFIAYPEKADVRFIKYHLDTLKFQMRNISRGTTQDNLSLDKLLSFEFRVPPLSMQRRIACILSAYDELIENNRRRIAILEQMARALYREWFVRPCLSGKLPKAWQLKKLGDVIELAYGKALKEEERRGGDVPVFGSSGVVGHHNESLARGPGIVLGRKGNVGSVYWSDSDFWPIDTVFFVVTKLSLPYVFYNLQHQTFLNNDAAVPGLSRNAAYLKSFMVPDIVTLESFDEFVLPIFAQLRVLRGENANLRRTRDLLLPRLMSGQIDVSRWVDEPSRARA